MLPLRLLERGIDGVAVTLLRPFTWRCGWCRRYNLRGVDKHECASCGRNRARGSIFE